MRALRRFLVAAAATLLLAVLFGTVQGKLASSVARAVSAAEPSKTRVRAKTSRGADSAVVSGAGAAVARKRRAEALARFHATRRARAAAAAAASATPKRRTATPAKTVTPAQAARLRALALRKRWAAARLRAMRLRAIALRKKALSARAGLVQSLPCSPDPSVCDFYFQGFQTQLPVLVLPENKREVPISPPILTSIDPSLIVEVDNSGHAIYADPQPPGTNSSTGTNDALQDVFYATYTPAVIMARNLQNFNFSLSGSCVGLPLLSLEISKPGGETFNLNPGDGNTKFAETRRCITFKIA